jgi:hypothetical protein
MELWDRLVSIGKTIVAYTILVIFFLFCWFILGIRDIKLMLVIFFGLVVVIAVVLVFFQDRKAKRPELFIGNLKMEENRSSLQTPYLRIYGEVFNGGKRTAHNCKLKVWAYQGTVKAIDTEISLGSIDGSRKKSVDEKIYYNGESLTSKTIRPEWKGKEKEKKLKLLTPKVS